ncbi:MAG: metalloendopeptidase-like rane protein [Thermoleophilia bacterium]|nr:metalloendopeptidase-like rane protein [Thermoleophilia bacterium]
MSRLSSSPDEHLPGSDHAPEGSGLLAGSVVDPADLLADGRYRRGIRRRERMLALVIAFAAIAAGAVFVAQAAFTDPGDTTGTAPTIAVQGNALGVLAAHPGAPSERIADAQPINGAATRDNAASASFTAGTDGNVARVERMTTSSSLSAARRQATSVAHVERVTLFDGRVVITDGGIEAHAVSRDGRATGEVVVTPGTKVVIDGKPVAISANKQVAIEGAGTLLLDEQAVVASAPTGDAQTGPRYRVVGALAHVRITQPYEGLPIGTELVIGRVDAGIREGKVEQVTHDDPNVAPAAPVSGGSSSSGAGLGQTGTPKPGEAGLPRRSVAVRADGASSSESLQHYTFPVLGSSNYVDTWGAARASTGIPHQGTDIFADEGTPIVAIADGTLNRVGWNTIGGYRFWLVDRFGNAFYNAHLSAFSPLALDGAQVKAGDVIGFVGHTGDAQFTPPHLHFEVHPGGGAPQNPFGFLNAWRKGTEVAIGLLTAADGAEKTGALSLQGFTDISSNSGLQESILDSVPNTTAKPVEFENAPVPTDGSLKAAIDGPGTTARK